MESPNPLEQMLSNLGAEGEASGRGGFGLDPRRAIELLRDQGSLGRNAPLFLLRAIHLQTQGATVRWKRILFGYNLEWDEDLGEVPLDTYRLLAEGAFESTKIRLQFRPGAVHLSNSDTMSAPFSVRFDETFGAAKSRLTHYPIEGLFPSQVPSQPFHEESYPEGQMEFLEAGVEHPLFTWVVCGINFPEETALPLRVVVKDDELVCDLTLSTVPTSERKELWLSRAHQVFQTLLAKTWDEEDTVLLDHEPLSRQTQTFLEYLPYIVGLEPTSELRQKTLQSVKYKDVFGQHWSLESLLELKDQQSKLLTVPSVPKDCPKNPLGDRPVILWRDETKRYGEYFFRDNQSGAGYLYSLRRGEVHQQNRSLGRVLCTVDWDFGTLGLRPMGSLESRCEIELVGTRRSSETVYLDEPAPNGLRVFWRSSEEVASWRSDEEFQALLQEKVVELIDQAHSEFQASPKWLLGLLEWAERVTDLEPYTNISSAPMLQRVDNNWSSLDDLKSLGGPVPILRDRSASIPKRLPFGVVLWYHPLLDRLGLPYKEVGKVVRQAHWQEQGREKWLKRYLPTKPQDSEYLKGRDWVMIDGSHFLARLDEEGATSRLVVWRESRPMCDRTLQGPDVPTGYQILYCDDDFPGDAYWSGPELSALREVMEWCCALEFESLLASLKS